jgi:hypothetical protein
MPQSTANRESPTLRAESVGRHTWQFQLRHLFGLTTISAIGAALIASYGAGTLLTFAGLLVAWLNYCGAFERLQVGRRRAALVWLAWTTFLASLALPSIKVFGPVLGFWAAWYAVMLPADAIYRGELLMKPGLLLFASINIANVLISMLPITLCRFPRKHIQSYMTALCIVMVGPWCVSWNETMLVGYYVWCSSFILALLAIPVRIWTFVAMVAAAVLIGIAANQTM